MPVPSKAVRVGSQAPGFTLPAVAGGQLSLSDYLARRCVVLVFLRGLF